MPQTAKPASEEQSIEYSICAYFHPVDKKDKDFEVVMVGKDMKEIMKKAEALHGGGKYQKVEVRQKYFEPKSNRQIDMTLKVMNTRAKKPMSLVTVILITLACGAGAFGLTVFLVGGKPPAETAEASLESQEDSP